MCARKEKARWKTVTDWNPALWTSRLISRNKPNALRMSQMAVIVVLTSTNRFYAYIQYMLQSQVGAVEICELKYQAKLGLIYAII